MFMLILSVWRWFTVHLVCRIPTRVTVPLDKVLSWDPPDTMVNDPPARYVVYFGTDESLVASGGVSVCFGQQSETKFDPPDDLLKLLTTYYGGSTWWITISGSP